MSNLDRPTFDYNEKPVRAGGILFYKKNIETDKYELLLIHSRNQYEDFGGCSDVKDKNIQDTIVREVYEESNKIFKKKFIRKKIKNSEPIYIPRCKYLMYFVELDKYYNPTDFGDTEIFENIQRTVHWIDYDNFENEDFINSLNFRLKGYSILNHLKNLFTQ